MIRAVVTTGLKEAEIRPADLLSRFRELSIEEAGTYFAEPTRRVDVPCPACGSSDARPAFEKQGFQYRQCRVCLSVFVSPRPDRESLEEYYRTSRAASFRVTELARRTAGARDHHLLHGWADWIDAVVYKEGGPAAKSFADLRTMLPEIFSEVKSLGLFDHLYCLQSPPSLHEKLTTLGVEITDRPSQVLGCITLFDQIEHHFAPEDFLRSAKGLLADDALVFFSTRTISGFDLQILWDRAPYIFVPEHLNLLSIEGLFALLERTGFESLEISTPGQLDVEFTLQSVKQDPSISLPPFIDYMLEKRSTDTHADFQEFLQKHRLSSHVRVAGKVKRK